MRLFPEDGGEYSFSRRPCANPSIDPAPEFFFLPESFPNSSRPFCLHFFAAHWADCDQPYPGRRCTNGTEEADAWFGMLGTAANRAWCLPVVCSARHPADQEEPVVSFH